MIFAKNSPGTLRNVFLNFSKNTGLPKTFGHSFDKNLIQQALRWFCDTFFAKISVVAVL